LSTGAGIAGGSGTGCGAGEFWDNAAEYNARIRVKRAVVNRRGRNTIMKRNLQTRPFKVNDFRGWWRMQVSGAVMVVMNGFVPAFNLLRGGAAFSCDE